MCYFNYQDKEMTGWLTHYQGHVTERDIAPCAVGLVPHYQVGANLATTSDVARMQGHNQSIDECNQYHQEAEA